jgi:hypothetical protein
MAEFSWAYIDSAAVLSAISGSVTISGSTNISGTLSASALIGDGSGLTNVAATASPAGSNTQIQYNNAGSLGASGNLTWDGSQITVVGNVTASAVSASTFVGNGSGLTNLPASDPFPYTGNVVATGSMSIVSGSTQVFGVDSSASGQGGVRGRMIQFIRTGFTLSSGGQAATGRYVSIGGNAVAVSSTPSNVNCMISPFSGRLISVMYHMPAGASFQDNADGTPQLEMRVGDVNALKGQTFGNALITTSQLTASSWPGTNIVGGVNIQTKVGSLGGTNVTGSWSFGTGSVVALYFKSGGGSSNYPGAATFTTVWEFDQLDPYISGSGN